jgi:hypothetical protein
MTAEVPTIRAYRRAYRRTEGSAYACLACFAYMARVGAASRTATTPRTNSDLQVNLLHTLGGCNHLARSHLC